MDTSNVFAFVEEMDRDDIFIEDEPECSNQDLVLNSLFPEYKIISLRYFE